MSQALVDALDWAQFEIRYALRVLRGRLSQGGASNFTTVIRDASGALEVARFESEGDETSEEEDRWWDENVGLIGQVMVDTYVGGVRVFTLAADGLSAW